MITRIVLILSIIISACVCFSSEIPSTEVYRIRVRNKPGGLIQVSLDQGRTYATAGRVKVAANTRIVGFAAASYIPNGTVAAVAVHGLRIKTGEFTQGAVGKAQMPLMFSLTPMEFYEIPQGYGGHIPRSSGILTDIYTGCSIFRNLAPYVGNQVFIEKNQGLNSLPEDYSPIVGDTYVIIVKRPDKMPTEIEFENKVGGSVIVKYDGGSDETIALVDRPVLGVGRYDGASFTGVGAVNTNHGGVITISTAPVGPAGSHEGGPVETRGGFMIQPYYHVEEQGEKHPQVMVLGPKDKSKPVLEGTPPLFHGFINTTSYPGKPDFSYRVQVKIDNGDWEPVPQIVGKANDAFTSAYLQNYYMKLGKSRTITTGVTSIRLLFSKYDPGLTASELRREANDCSARAIASGTKPVKGLACIQFKKAQKIQGMIRFAVDSRIVCTSSDHSGVFNWDSSEFPNGLHTIDMIDENNSIVESVIVLGKN